MSRWYASAEQYLVDNNDRPVAGPFSRDEPVIVLVDRVYRQRGYAYWNASRYQLAKAGGFPRNKAGNEALTQAIAFPELAALVLPLLGRSTIARGFADADWPAIDALLLERGILEPVPC